MQYVRSRYGRPLLSVRISFIGYGVFGVPGSSGYRTAGWVFIATGRCERHQGRRCSAVLSSPTGMAAFFDASNSALIWYRNIQNQRLIGPHMYITLLRLLNQYYNYVQKLLLYDGIDFYLFVDAPFSGPIASFVFCASARDSVYVLITSPITLKWNFFSELPSL